MSSDPPSAGPSPAAEAPDPELELASLVRARGEPLLEALQAHLPGSLEHAEAAGR